MCVCIDTTYHFLLDPDVYYGKGMLEEYNIWKDVVLRVFIIRIMATVGGRYGKRLCLNVSKKMHTVA